MKIINPFSFKRQFSLEYASSINDGIYLLSKFVTKPTFRPTFHEVLIGKISPDKIEIRLFRPGPGHLLIPAFYGKFVTDSGKTFLTGEFRLDKIMKTTYIFIFLMCILLAVIIKDESIVILFSFIFLSVILCFKIPSFKKEMETIEQQIRNILTKGCI